MRGIVKWFNNQKGYGFITDSYGKDHFFHYSSIQMKRKFRFLNEGDIVEFEVEQGTNDREQAVNVQPLLTRSMIRHALKKENLQLKILNEASGNRAYMVVDANNVIQTSEHGMTLEELAGYAGLHYPM